MPQKCQQLLHAQQAAALGRGYPQCIDLASSAGSNLPVRASAVRACPSSKLLSGWVRALLKPRQELALCAGRVHGAMSQTAPDTRTRARRMHICRCFQRGAPDAHQRTEALAVGERAATRAAVAPAVSHGCAWTATVNAAATTTRSSSALAITLAAEWR